MESITFKYSRVPNKRLGCENNQGGLEIVQNNNNWGVGTTGGLQIARYDKSRGFEQPGEEAGQIENSHFSLS